MNLVNVPRAAASSFLTSSICPNANNRSGSLPAVSGVEETAGGFQLSGGDVLPRQLPPQIDVGRVDRHHLGERIQGCRVPPRFLQLVGRCSKEADGLRLVAKRLGGTCAGQDRLCIRLRQRRQPHQTIRGPLIVAALAAQLPQPAQVGSRVRQQFLSAAISASRSSVCSWSGLGLQRLLVEGGRLRKEAFAKEMIRNPGELRDGAIDIAGAQIQIAERVDGVPVARLIVDQPDVLRDGPSSFPWRSSFSACRSVASRSIGTVRTPHDNGSGVNGSSLEFSRGWMLHRIKQARSAA